MIFLCPVKHRLQNIFCTHLSFTCHVISTSRAIRNYSIRKYPVKIPRYSSLKPGIQRISMIVNHIHDHTKTSFVNCLDHLFHFPDSDFTMSGICRIGALRHIVIDRVVPPVELRIFPCFIYRTIIIHWHDLNMCHPEFF